MIGRPFPISSTMVSKGGFTSSSSVESYMPHFAMSGWMFWHWGLMYAILAHFAAGTVRGIVIQLFGSRLFG